MSPRVPLAALLLALAPFARAGVGRAVEVVPVEGTSFKTGSSAPGITLQFDAAKALAIPGLAPAVTPTALGLPTPAIAAGAPAKPVDALTKTGAVLAKAAPASPAAANELDALFTGGTAKAASAEEVSALTPGAAAAPLERSRPSATTSRRLPPGVKRAFQNSAVLGGGMAGLSSALYLWMQTLSSPPNLETFAIVAFPLVLIPFHFALVSGFWASRYYGYPKLSSSGKTAFRRLWQALAILYPLAALPALASWLLILGREPALLLLLGMPLLVALGEVVHHFVYRAVPERAQDKGKSLLDWRSRLGGNIGQQLARMRAKP